MGASNSAVEKPTVAKSETDEDLFKTQVGLHILSY